MTEWQDREFKQGYYKVVFKKTVATYGDIRFLDDGLVELTYNNGSKAVFHLNDLLLLEEADRHITGER